ncbi:MAG: ribonuclease III, partial [Clostridia bacterium]|nr:ribonuclease III [Clostridia bacterium]
MEALEAKIGYSFSDRGFLEEALTHSSYANELKAKKQTVQCNERLEFLGDSVLSVVVSEYL